jgi:ubiquitin-like-conjugating enzyme ATG10
MLMATLDNFPHLSHAEFDEACTSLLQRFHDSSHMQQEWTSVDTIQKYDEKYLRITKPLHTSPSQPPNSTAKEVPEEFEIAEEDDQVRPPQIRSKERPRRDQNTAQKIMKYIHT